MPMDLQVTHGEKMKGGEWEVEDGEGSASLPSSPVPKAGARTQGANPIGR